MGACFEVYKEKGHGFVEPVYQECLEIELGLQGIPFVAQGELELTYKGRQLRQTYRPAPATGALRDGKLNRLGRG